MMVVVVQPSQLSPRPGLIAAAALPPPPSDEPHENRAVRQRCLIHRARNVLAKVSAGDQAQVKADYGRIFDDITEGPGEAAIAETHRRAETFPATRPSLLRKLTRPRMA